MAEPDTPDVNDDLKPAAGLDADAVAEWLALHPDFLSDRPDLAERLTLPDGDGIVSLTEFRSRRLMEENLRLNGQLSELTRHADRNEDLIRRLHALTLSLSEAETPEALVRLLARSLVDDFYADALHLRLAAELDGDGAGIRVEVWQGEGPDWVQPAGSGRPDCGRLTQAKRDWLFGDGSERVGSAALVPLGGDGLLAIGSAADDRFQPGMGTLFLELLGATLAHRLRALTADGEQRRSA
jgi:uncharacterized protein YigA (DUF484 family)